MQPATLLLLALSAVLPSTLAAPTVSAPTTSTNETTTTLHPRGWSFGPPKIGCFTDNTCTLKSLIPPPPHTKYAQGWDCIKFTPENDNVGINWGNGPRADYVTFYTDDKCTKYAAKRVESPKNSMYTNLDNGKGKANKCVSYRANGGNWKSVKFAYPVHEGSSNGM